jgi:hypothetical protein
MASPSTQAPLSSLASSAYTRTFPLMAVISFAPKFSWELPPTIVVHSGGLVLPALPWSPHPTYENTLPTASASSDIISVGAAIFGSTGGSRINRARSAPLGPSSSISKHLLSSTFVTVDVCLTPSREVSVTANGTFTPSVVKSSGRR